MEHRRRAFHQHLHFNAPQVHRAPGSSGSTVQIIPSRRSAEIQDIGRAVKNLSNAMNAEIVDHRTALRLRKGVDGMAEITKRCAGAQGLFGAFE